MSAKVDFNDPQVKKAVYSMYRNILGGYNQKANSIVSAMPKERVREDQGINRQIESMIRQSNQISGGGNGGPMAPSGPGVPPPPPPIAVGGTIPSMRIPSEIPARKEPPAAIQNAMMTKDKKPFTYTPGGLDLSEIRSPRMQRRVNRNAHTEDSCTTPQQRPLQPSPLAQPLPPSALAAMQPQIAVPVFPPGNPPPSVGSMSSPVTPPTQGVVASPVPTSGGPPAPPPPPMPPSDIPPPPPPPPPSTASSAPAPPPLPQNQTSDITNDGPAKSLPHPKPDFLADIQNRPPLRPVSQSYQKPPADFIAEIPNHAPLRPVHFGSRQSQEPPPSPLQGQIQLKPIPPKPKEISQEVPPAPGQILNQIPIPNQQKQQEFTQPPPTPPTPVAQEDHNRPSPKFQAPPLHIPPNEYIQTPQGTPVKQTPPTPSGLNRSPAPWMTSQKQMQKDTPPWASRENSRKEENIITEEKQFKEEMSSMTMNQGQASSRIIPVQVEGREPPSQVWTPTQGTSGQTQIQGMFQTLQQENIQTTQSRTRIIPIQLEGSNENTQQNLQRQMSNPTRPSVSQNKYPGGAPQTPTSYVSGDSSDGRQRQFQTQVSWTPGNPTQSRSFRVLQKITGSEDMNQEEGEGRIFIFPGCLEGMNMHPGQALLMNRVFPRQETVTPHFGEDAQYQSAPNTPGTESNRRPDESEF